MVLVRFGKVLYAFGMVFISLGWFGKVLISLVRFGKVW